MRDVFSGLALFAGLDYDRPLAWVLLLGTYDSLRGHDRRAGLAHGLISLTNAHLLAIVLLLG
jgi:hypothetical protein